MHQQKRRAEDKKPDFDGNDIAAPIYMISCISVIHEQRIERKGI